MQPAGAETECDLWPLGTYDWESHSRNVPSRSIPHVEFAAWITFSIVLCCLWRASVHSYRSAGFNSHRRRRYCFHLSLPSPLWNSQPFIRIVRRRPGSSLRTSSCRPSVQAAGSPGCVVEFWEKLKISSTASLWCSDKPCLMKDGSSGEEEEEVTSLTRRI